MLSNVVIRNDLIRDDLIQRVDFERLDFWEWRTCTVRILIVADGGIDFQNGASPGFGLSELITKALNTSSMPFVRFNITKAHRRTGAGADITNFRFDAATTTPTNRPFKLDNYDQVWLFGVEGAAFSLSPAELTAISQFMNAGGGVFATGDHEDLGLGLCGEVPRVRTMRKWYFVSPPPPTGRLQAPPVNGVNRLDTHREGPTPGYQFADQSDAVPQVIAPRYYASGGATYPHPLLNKTGGAISVLPDHAHEGECVVPTNLTTTINIPGVSGDEYPLMLGSTSIRVAPEVVAIASSSGGAIDGRPDKPKVNPRCFGAIGAYDGHLAGVGRVAVDSTWHHFLNINLNGSGSARNGFYVGGVPTPEYEDIKQYFRNIALWISPPALQRCFRSRVIFTVRYLYPLIEEIRLIPDPRLADILNVGAFTRETLAQLVSPAEAVQISTALLDTQFEKDQFNLRSLINPWVPKDKQAPALDLLSSDLLPNAILGGVMLTIANQLPADPIQLAEKFANQKDDSEFERILTEGAKLGLKAFRESLEVSAKSFLELAKLLG